MSKIKKFFLTMAAMATMLLFKAGNVFGTQALYGVPSPSVNRTPDLYGVFDPAINETPALYGIPQPEPVNDFGNIFGKIALFVLLPLCIIALITVGIVALVKIKKKKKQATNTNQNINNNNNGNVQ